MKNLESLIAALAKTTSEFFAQDSTLNKEQGEQPVEEFVVSFKANAEGDLSMDIQWPKHNVVAPVQAVNIMATLLHQISNGAWKPIMIRGVQAYGLQADQNEVANAILEEWASKSQIEHGRAICVDPTSVFRGNDS